MTVTVKSIQKAQSIVKKYTILAAGTGAIPLPAASGALVGETGAMLAHLRSVFGCPIEWETVAEAIGFAGGLNMIGKTLFIEVAKSLSWGTGSPWAALALSGFGATTAGVQTYIIGQLAIEIGKNDGQAITKRKANKVIKDSTLYYEQNKDMFQKKSKRRTRKYRVVN